jgi:hypothetical protein
MFNQEDMEVLPANKKFLPQVKVLPRNRGFSNKGLTKKQRVFVERQRFSYEKI